MKVLPIIRVVALVCGGLVAGVALGDREGASYARAGMDVHCLVQYQQFQHMHFVTFMPLLTMVSILAPLIWIMLIRSQWRTLRFWLLVTSVLGFTLCMTVSAVVNFPINHLLMTWSAAAPPADVRQLWAPWEGANSVRAVATCLGFLLQAVVIGTNASGAGISRSI
ncbi:MAG: anthrone oxygenase family protein [Rudaea sp.]